MHIHPYLPSDARSPIQIDRNRKEKKKQGTQKYDTEEKQKRKARNERNTQHTTHNTQMHNIYIYITHNGVISSS